MAIRLMKAYLVAGAASIALIAATPGEAQQRSFNVPAQSAAKAIPEFARQAGVQIVATGGKLRNLRTHAVQGEMDVRKALTRMIEGTGLRIASDDGSRISLTAATPGEQLPAAGNADSPSSMGGETADEIIVTGTNIRGQAPVGSPLQTYSRSDIEKTGATTAEQFFRTIPQNLASTSPQSSNSNVIGPTNVFTGTGVNIHGVGTASTLVLIDGRRISAGGTFGLFTDISMVPLGVVDRIDILADGASAIYGADAIGGVVNVILRKQYEGMETTLRSGISTSGGGEQLGFAQTAGVNWKNGGLLVSYDFNKSRPLEAAQRDFAPRYTSKFFLIPGQTQHSAYGRLRQSLANTIDLAASVSYGDRAFTTAVADPVAPIRGIGRGHVRQLGGTLSVSWNPAPKWNVILDGSYSRNHQNAKSANVYYGVVYPEANQKSFTSLKNIDLRGSGALFDLPGGAVRTAAGLSYRGESLNDASGLLYLGGQRLSRTVTSGYAELIVPVISPDNGGRLIQDLLISGAVRYDKYSDFGGSFSPKIGISGRFLNEITLRGSWGKSYKAPSLSQLTDSNRSFVALNLVNPASPSGFTNTLLYSSSGNPQLKAERSAAFTIGFDWTPEVIKGLRLSATYFDIRYTDRIAAAPLKGSFVNAFLEYDNVTEFFELAPSLDRLNQLVSTGTFYDVPQTGLASVGAIFDFRVRNLESTRSSGLDLSLAYSLPLGPGTLSLDGSATYLIHDESRVSANLPNVERVGLTYFPPKLKARASVGYSTDAMAINVAANYTGGSQNQLAMPFQSVGNFVTLDGQISAHIAGQDNKGLTLILSAQNLLDTEPPLVTTNSATAISLNYDPANASPLGRFVSLAARIKW